MNNKNNLNQAVYDMFGVGKTQEEEPMDRAQESAPYEAQQPQENPSYMVPQSQNTTVAPADLTRPVGPTVAPFSVVAATYIAPGTVVEGSLKSKGDVEIAGTFRGDISSNGDVTVRTSIEGNIEAVNLRVVDCKLKGDSKVSGRLLIDENSIIEGDVEAGDLVCAGTLRGNSDVANNISLNSTAKIIGDIITDTMSMERGASISGSLTMGQR